MKIEPRRGFTIVEMLVSVGIIALLMGILLPALGSARDQARLTRSQANLRQLSTAHASYAADWNDRQFTLVHDNLSRYGGSRAEAFANYHALNGGCGSPTSPGCHPGVILGRGDTPGQYNSQNGIVGYWMNLVGNQGMVLPMGFESDFYQAFGSFRIPNCHQFSRYVSGRFYDPVFFAPKDTAVNNATELCQQDPAEFSTICHELDPGARPFWSSYCLSPAAMFNPQVMRAPIPGNEQSGGWQDPWDLPSGFRSPAMSQARMPDLKTHMLEHHWLQGTRIDCNPAFGGWGSYNGCEPYYFNASADSAPLALFYDGHVGSVSTLESEQADRRMMTQSGRGLWSRDTPLGPIGYFSDTAYDDTQISYHVLTTDGILGRDTLSR